MGESSAAIRGRVEAAREIQRRRFAGAETSGDVAVRLQGVACNADMRGGDVRKFCRLDEAGDALLRAAMSQLNLSARAYHRVLKLARTIADLAGSEQIQTPHVAEALQYRPKLMMN